MIPLVALLALCSPALASILAVDYGADTMKVALMKPGVPFDVVLDRDSKRKIASVVGWKGEDRLFGQDGRNLATRFPADTFASLKPVQGVLFDSGETSYYTSATQIAFGSTSRGTFAGKRPNGEEFSVEELVAMQLDYVRELAGSVAGENVRDVVVTVPTYFNQFQRQAVIDATEIAGLKLLTLVNDGTAIAINYAMTRTFPTRELHIIYDSGASSTRATLVSFLTTTLTTGSKKSLKSENVTQITVLGSGADTLASGTELSRRLTTILEEKIPKGLRDGLIDRSYAKLAREAERVKAVLSVNGEVNAGVEGLVGEKDWKAKIERKVFERACEDLYWRFQQPLLDAIAGTEVGLADLDSIIMHGGTTRVPFVQTVLKSTVGSDKIATNVNADEAAVLGTAFYGASLSRQFKTKPVKVQDIVGRDIYLSYTAEGKKDGNPRTINTLVFPVRSAAGLKKTLTLKRKADFGVTVGFKDSDVTTPALTYEISGVEAAFTNLTERGASDAAVKLTLLYSESGLASVVEASVTGTVKDDSLTGKIKNFFGGSSTTTATESTSTTDAAAAEETKPAEPVERVESIALELKVEPVTVVPLTREEKSKARTRLIKLNKAATSKREREEAYNNLEGFLYRLRRLLSDDSTDSPFTEFSTPEEREKLEAAVDEAMVWLDEGEGTKADAKALWARRDTIEAMEKPITHRFKEAETGPQALKDLQQAMFAAKLFVSSAHENRTKLEEHIALENASTPDSDPLPALTPMAEYTDAELKDVESQMAEIEVYLNDKVDLQRSLPKHADPVLVTSEMNSRGMRLQGTVQRLTRRRPKARAVKKPVTSTTATEKAEETKRVKEEL
ncbi:actin-like ATPase domain-containing protein [Ceratobasidium sp. AG-I]|nr:actin-like ATPase domain-containing protein [Ceratobasidium sp. AG-I]